MIKVTKVNHIVKMLFQQKKIKLIIEFLYFDHH
jgi:hypothetical protein